MIQFLFIALCTAPFLALFVAAIKFFVKDLNANDGDLYMKNYKKSRSTRPNDKVC